MEYQGLLPGQFGGIAGLGTFLAKAGQEGWRVVTILQNAEGMPTYVILERETSA